ncbi:hypothetical protein BGX34_001770, partial [Mortierella sp. NVP85]
IPKVVYSPQGDRIASSNFNGVEYTVQLWNVAPEDCPSAIPTGIRTDRLFVYSPKGDQVASSEGRDILLWDVKTEKLLYALAGHSKGTRQMVYSPQGNIIASAGQEDDTIIRLWDVETGVCLRLLAGHSQGICSMVFSPNGDQIISGSKDKTVRIWDIGVRSSQRTSSSHAGDVHMVKCSPKGDQVASCSGDMTVRLWDVETGSCRYILRHRKAVRCIAYSPEGDQIATGSIHTAVRLWDTETGSCIRMILHYKVNGISYSPQKDRLATFNYDGSVRFWNVGSGECLRTLFPDVYSAALSPNWGHIVIMCTSKVQLRDVETGDCIDELRGVDDIDRMIWSPQGDQIAMICLGKLALWKINKNQARNESDGGSILYIDLKCELVTFSPNGLQIAFFRYNHHNHHHDNALYLYDTVTGTQLWASKGHTGEITSIVYSSHGDLVATASRDQTVRLWDVVSGQCRAVIQDFQREVRDIAWVETSNAQYVFAGCQDGVVGMWQVIMDKERCQVRLHWKTTNGMFNAEAAVEDGKNGEDDESKESGEGDQGDEGEGNEENDENGKDVNQRASISPSEGLLKRPSEPDEEDEGVAKRMCGNEEVSSMEE